MKNRAVKALVWPSIAGALTGAVLLGISYYFPSLSLCTIVFLIAAMLMAIFTPLNSGPAFGGWVKASTTAIDGMNSDIRSRARASFMDRMGAILFLLSAILVYILPGMLNI